MRMELLQELPGLAETSANTVGDGDMTQEVITYYRTATRVLRRKRLTVLA